MQLLTERCSATGCLTARRRAQCPPGRRGVIAHLDAIVGVNPDKPCAFVVFHLGNGERFAQERHGIELGECLIWHGGCPNELGLARPERWPPAGAALAGRAEQAATAGIDARREICVPDPWVDPVCRLDGFAAAVEVLV
jgi:hypothetical protein